jgi:signal transduction histidine kinase/PAS domain-containing protein
MDKLENDHKPEKAADLPSQLHNQPPDQRTEGNIEKDVGTQSLPEQRWQRITQWLKISTFTPEWLPTPWNHPIVGYLFAILIPLGSMILAVLLRNIFLTFVFPGVLVVMAILLVALLWGTVPGLLATLWGTILFNIIILPPQYSLSLHTFQQVFETCFLLFIGVIISLVVSRIERARAKAVLARQELEMAHASLQRLEQELARRASEVEAIFESMADGIYVYDKQGRVVRTNIAAQTFNPLTRQPDYSIRPFPERIKSFLPRDEHGRSLELSDLPVMRVLQGETLTGSHTADIILQRPDGTDVLLNVSGAPMLDAMGGIQGAVIVTRDVTERRRLEQHTHEALDALLAMANVIVQVSDEADTTLIETSEQTLPVSRNVAQRLADLTRSFLGCQRLSISIVEPETKFLRPLAVVGLSPEQEQKWWDEHLQQKLRLTDGPDRAVIQRLQADEVVLLDMTQPLWNSYPNPYKILTVLIAPISIRDRFVGLMSLDYGGAEHTYTSEELALAGGVAKLITLVIEREQLLRERARADARELALRQAKERMDEFISIVSHELRTPLTTIKGNIQLARLRLRASLREVPANNDVLRSMLEEIQMMLERAERQANVQNRMVSDLLDISRLQADKLELHLVPCDLATIVHEMVEDQRSITPKRTIHLVMEEGVTAPAIADTERIGQVLSNYLTNALKYSKVGHPVVVQLKKEENMVRILVRDEGPGLTPSEQEQIWERFYQVEGIKRRRGSSVGLGLGLHICRAIIEEHRGEVGVESTKGEGSTFWFTLPLAEEDHDA